jgi:hypothetical protein
MEKAMDRLMMILYPQASFVDVSMSKCMLFASLIVLRATHVGLGG